MSEAISTEALSDLNRISISSWEANAFAWDDFMGDEGNDFFSVLEWPALEKLTSIKEGDYVLDLATGNGLVARKFASLGAIVTATDASPNLLKLAAQRTTEDEASRITYILQDLTIDTDFDKIIEGGLKHGGFDVITINMVIMDIPTIKPLAAALPRLLKRNGKFVASVCHPVFFSPGAARHMELGGNPDTGRYEYKHSVNVIQYLDIPPTKGEAIPGQPSPQLYFHRSFQDLFRPFFEAGLKLDGLEEPSFTSGPSKREIHSYHNFPQIPPVLVFRLTL